MNGVDKALIEYCTAWENGDLNGSDGGGPVGIWTWGANEIIIEYSLSFRNSNGGKNTVRN